MVSTRFTVVAPRWLRAVQVRAVQRREVVDEDGGGEVADVVEVGLFLAVPDHAHRVAGPRDGDEALRVVRAHEEGDVGAAEAAQRLRDGEGAEHVAHADGGAAVHAEEHARLAQEALRHPEVLEVVDREARALVQDEPAHPLAEARGPVHHGPPERDHRPVLLVDRGPAPRAALPCRRGARAGRPPRAS